MRKIHKLFSVCLILVLVFQNIASVYGADFYDINSEEVFIKQQGSDTCTLSAAAMMLRRAAILRGDENWKDITESSIRSVAWYEGAGLRWSFSYNGMSVAHGNLTGTTDTKTSLLIGLLDKHPEGIVLYGKKSTGGTHAVLLTDYTDGQFYCFDPSNGCKDGRIPLSEGLGVCPDNAVSYWYISNASLTLESIVLTEGVEIKADSQKVCVGDTLKLVAVVKPENATHKEAVWTTSDAGIATVSQDGEVTGVSPGTVVITCTVKGGSTAAIEITVEKKFTGFKKLDDGQWYYYVDGQYQNDYIGLVRGGDGYWWYVKDGKIQTDYTGFITNSIATWYVVGGKIDTGFTGLGYDAASGKWLGVVGGKVDMNFTGLISNAGYWWYVENGVLNTGYTGFFTNDAGTWYVTGGKIDINFTGLGYDKDKWLCVVNGRHYSDFTGIVKNADSWWYVKDGILDVTFNGIYEDGEGKWLIVNGKVAGAY